LHPPSQDEPFFILSSVSSEETLEFVELDTSAIFFLDLHKLQVGGSAFRQMPFRTTFQTDLWHDALDQLPRESASGPFVSFPPILFCQRALMEGGSARKAELKIAAARSANT